MIIDTLGQFSDSGDFANEAGTANIGDIIDLGVADRDPGQGQPLYLIIVVETSADGGAGAAGTTQFQLVSDATTTVATNGTQTIHLITKAHVAGDLTQGTVLVYGLPASGLTYERYLGLQIIQAAEGEDDLVCSAFLSIDPHGWSAKPDGSN